MQLTTKPQYSTALCIVLIFFGANLFAQFNSFVIGAVETADDTGLEVPPTDIRMLLTSSGNTTAFTSTTSYNASASSNPYSFFFSNNGSNNSVKIYVDKSTTDDNYVDLYCIKSSDMVWVSQYLQGISTFTSAQKVAADVNIDGSIDIFDYVSIRRVILGWDDEFNNSLVVNGVAYSNVSAVYPTNDDLLALNSATFNVQYTCVYDYNPLLFSLIGRNFTAVRLGDVNQSCDNFFTGN